MHMFQVEKTAGGSASFRRSRSSRHPKRVPPAVLWMGCGLFRSAGGRFSCPDRLQIEFHTPIILRVWAWIFFFVISGFLITDALIKEKIAKGGISLKNFYLRRCSGLFPRILYLCLVVLLDVVSNGLECCIPRHSFLFIRNFFGVPRALDHLSTHYWSLSGKNSFISSFTFIRRKSFPCTFRFFCSRSWAFPSDWTGLGEFCGMLLSEGSALDCDAGPSREVPGQRDWVADLVLLFINQFSLFLRAHQGISTRGFCQ